MLEKVPVSLADQIQPPVFPQVFEKNIEGKETLVIQVFPGGQKPYCLAAEGIEKGVYIRVGAHTRRAEGAVLEELRLLRTRLSFDEAPVAACPLTDLQASRLPPNLRTEKAMLSLDVVRRDPFSGAVQPTRGGVLMLCSHPEKLIPEAYIIISRMRGNAGRNTIHTQEITGTLPEQSESALALLEEWLGRNPVVHGARYTASGRQLPPEAVREAVNNALFHRQYSIPGPIKIAYYADRLEIFSPGHFAGPFIPESLGDGVSYIRNRVVCHTARRLGLIEKRGTGIRLIQDAMAARGLPAPLFQEGDNWFKVTLVFTPVAAAASGQTPEGAVMDLFNSLVEISSAQVCKKLGVSKATAVKVLSQLMLKEAIIKTGKGPFTRYRIK
jgi:predicted HTH transcriptional regulator